MFGRLARWQPDQGAAVGALTLAALAVIHVVDLPGTLGPDRLVGIGYLGIIVAAVLTDGVLLALPHWLGLGARCGGGRLGDGWVHPHPRPAGGFLGDHGDVGNWHCSLGITALSVESLTM